MPALVSAILFGALALVWLLAGRWLPGGRWVVVHLFTLGVLTTLIAAFTRHFATMFTGQGAARPGRRPWFAALVLDVSVIAMLVGRLTHGGLLGRVLMGVGTVGLLGYVGANLLALRRARRGARTHRFVWVVRRYEDAHLAFLAGALAGTTVGIGAAEGGWYLGVRDAHVHLNVLGWAGLTVLATLVVFGPALLRTRMPPGADDRAATALRAAAVALLVVTLGVAVAGGVEGTAATVGRSLAVAALVVYGAAVVVVVTSTLRATASATPSPVRWSVAAAALWFPVGVTVDIVAVAIADRRLFDLVGVILFVGVLVQIILSVLIHLAPQLRGQDSATRDALIRRTGRGAFARTVVLNLGVLLVTVAVSLDLGAGFDTTVLVRLGWITLAAGVAAHVLPAIWPAPSRERAS